MPSNGYTLDQLGWRPGYAQHLTLEDFEAGWLARVLAVHRSGVQVLGSRGAASVALPSSLAATLDGGLAVGDWVTVEDDAPRVRRVIERHSLIARLAAGRGRRMQAIAANLDTLLVVSSCNEDFNPARLERYLALARDARVTPVVVLTRADLADAAPYLDRAGTVAQGVEVLALDATSPAAAVPLAPWLGAGRTLALVGSSGVGKSTLTNTLAGAAQSTGAIRQDDARGRHTTTAREMFALPGGAWLIDTPGMRELRIGAVAEGLEAAFDDIGALAEGCRFRDCSHAGDAGCAVERAVADGRLEARRLASFRKLEREAADAARTLGERHEHDRQFGALQRQAQRSKKARRTTP